MQMETESRFLVAEDQGWKVIGKRDFLLAFGTEVVAHRLTGRYLCQNYEDQALM